MMMGGRITTRSFLLCSQEIALIRTLIEKHPVQNNRVDEYQKKNTSKE